MRRTRDSFDRFLEKFSAPGPADCWPWTAHISPQGYGQFYWKGGNGLAHRFSYEVAYGPMPDELVTDHLCKNRCCVNPMHLEAVTMGENTRRGTAYTQIAKRRLAKKCKRGHDFSPENTATDRAGDRYCKSCQAIKGREWRVRNRERVNELQRIRRASA